MENLIKIKHTNVKCEPAAPDTDDFAPVLEDLELICASARIDAVTASITKLSRSKAVELFRTQKIFVNGKCMEKQQLCVKTGRYSCYPRHRQVHLQGLWK
mgnify:CR=1 FL=1